MKSCNCKKGFLSVFLMSSSLIYSQSSNIEVNFKPNAGTTNQVNTDINVLNSLGETNFSSSDVTCIATTALNGEVSYRVQ